MMVAMSKFLSFVVHLSLTLTSLAYPLFWLWQGDSFVLAILPFLLALLWLLKAEFFSPPKSKKLAFGIAFFLLLIAGLRSQYLMFWYPVLSNAMMLSLFGGSLWSEQSLVERLARLHTPNLPPHAIRYTRNVTLLWCGVFGLNILITSGLILLENYTAWAFYTSVISYVIIGVVMCLEWIVRQRVMRKYDE